MTADGVPALAVAHTAWWAAYWSQSAISLDGTHNQTEAFWWSALYALGSASRAGQVCLGRRVLDDGCTCVPEGLCVSRGHVLLQKKSGVP